MVEGTVALADTLGAHLDLVRALLARHVEYIHVAHAQDGLQGEGRLAYAGLATQQDDAAGHNASTQYTVELAVVGVDAWVFLGGDVAESQGMAVALAHAAVGIECLRCRLGGGGARIG